MISKSQVYLPLNTVIIIEISMDSGNIKLIKQAITDQPAYTHCYNTVFYQM